MSSGKLYYALTTRHIRNVKGNSEISLTSKKTRQAAQDGRQIF